MASKILTFFRRCLCCCRNYDDQRHQGSVQLRPRNHSFLAIEEEFSSDDSFTEGENIYVPPMAQRSFFLSQSMLEKHDNFDIFLKNLSMSTNNMAESSNAQVTLQEEWANYTTSSSSSTENNASSGTSFSVFPDIAKRKQMRAQITGSLISGKALNIRYNDEESIKSFSSIEEKIANF